MGNNLFLSENINEHLSSSKSLLEYTHFGYMWTTVKTGKIMASHTVYALLEAEPFSEFLDEKKWRGYVHPQDLYKLIQTEELLRETGKPCSCEYRLITKTSRHIFISHHMQLSISHDNNVKILSILDDITEQKHAEVILEVMNEGFFELDVHYKFRRINAKTELLWNIQRADVIGKSIWEVFPEAKNTSFYELVIKAVHEKINNIQDVVGPVNNHWLHFSASPYNDGTIVIFYDIQNEKEAEQKAKESTNLIQSVFDTTLVAMSVLKAVRNQDGNVDDFEIKMVNNQLQKLTGKTDLIGKLYAEEYPGIKKTELFNVMLQVIETGSPQQIEYFYPYDGFDKWFSSMFVKLGDGVVGTNLDITERKFAEQEQLKNYTLLQQSEEISMSGSWDYNINTKDFMWSDGMYQLFNLKKHSPVTPSVYLDNVIPEDRHIAQKIVDAIQNNFQPFNETLRIQPDGVIKTLKIKATPLQNKETSTNKMLGIDIDITAAKEAEKKIYNINASLVKKNKELKQRNKELIALNNVANYDLKEPLRKIYTAVEAVISNEAAKLSNNGKAHLRRIQSSTQRMGLIIDDLLSYTGITKEKNPEDYSEVDLNKVLENAKRKIQRLLDENNAVIKAENLPNICGNYNLLVQLFQNIIHNAVKFQRNNKPEINIFVKQVKKENENYLNISFKDNGIGFKQQEAENMFNLFTKLHPEEEFRGSGMGLAVCKKIMEQHDGLIEAASTEDKGTEICCYFPID